MLVRQNEFEPVGWRTNPRGPVVQTVKAETTPPSEPPPAQPARKRTGWVTDRFNRGKSPMNRGDHHASLPSASRIDSCHTAMARKGPVLSAATSPSLPATPVAGSARSPGDYNRTNVR